MTIPTPNTLHNPNYSKHQETVKQVQDEQPVPQTKMEDTSLVRLFKAIANFDMVLALAIVAAELFLAAFPDSYIAIYNIFNMKGEVIDARFSADPPTFFLVIVFSALWLIFEFWLYEQIYKGALDLNTHQLNRWILCRSVLLGANIGAILYRIFELSFCLYDLIYLPVIMYRILEIIFVKGLSAEIRRFLNELIV